MENLLIIQARVGSTRLPNKVLKQLAGRPMLQFIIERVKYAKTIDGFLVATTNKERDNAIEELCKLLHINCYRGSENDVLDRYYQAAKIYSPQNVIRITADCPLIDPEIIDKIVSVHMAGNYDYTSNTLVETYPDGLDTEVMRYTALEKAWENALLSSEREHVTPYIKFKGDFRKFSVERIPSLADKRWTVDTERDFIFISKICDSLFSEKELFLIEDILRYIDNNQQIENINRGIKRNEGYQLSLKNEHIVRR